MNPNESQVGQGERDIHELAWLSQRRKIQRGWTGHHHRRRHVRLELRLDSDGGHILDLGRHHRPDVSHRLHRQKGFNRISVVGGDHRPAAERCVLVRSQAELVGALHQTGRQEESVAIGDAIGNHGAAEGINQGDTCVGQRWRTRGKEGEFIHRPDHHRSVSI